MIQARISRYTDTGEQIVGDLVVRGTAVEPAAPNQQLDGIIQTIGVFDPQLGRQLDPRTDGERYLDGLAEELNRTSTLRLDPID